MVLLGLREQCLEVVLLGFRRKCLSYCLCWVLGNKGIVGPKEIVPGIQALLGSREQGHSWALGVVPRIKTYVGFREIDVLFGVREQCLRQWLTLTLGNSATVGRQGREFHLCFKEQQYCWGQGIVSGIVPHLCFREQRDCWALVNSILEQLCTCILGNGAWNTDSAGFQGIVALLGLREQPLTQV